MTTIVRRTIAFNTEDPKQKALLDFVDSQTSNFSAYGKGLILLDMMRTNGEMTAWTAPNSAYGAVPVVQDDEDASGGRADELSDADRKLMSDLLG